jgi:uncharacterized membrane protein
MLIFYKTGKFLLNSIGELPISNRSANSIMGNSFSRLCGTIENSILNMLVIQYVINQPGTSVIQWSEMARETITRDISKRYFRGRPGLASISILVYIAKIIYLF